MSRFLTAHQYN